MNKRRIVIYVLCAAALFFAVLVKQRVVIAHRDKKIVSTFSQWQEYGKPVIVTAVKKGDVRVLTKMTIVAVSGQEYEGYVPGITREKLAAGQEVFLTSNDTQAAGQVVAVADARDMNAGMFRVQVVFSTPTVDSEDRMVVYVKTGMFSDVVCVPNNVLDSEGDEYVLWTAVNGRAQKRVVEILERNGYGAIIHTGLDDGELLIVQGFTRLSEGDMLNILDDLALGEIDDD